jgi:hypothetical protein
VPHMVVRVGCLCRILISNCYIFTLATHMYSVHKNSYKLPTSGNNV